MNLPADSSAALVERHRPEILRYLVRLLGDQDDAQDTCQDVFLRAYRGLRSFRGQSPAGFIPGVDGWMVRSQIQLAF